MRRITFLLLLLIPILMLGSCSGVKVEDKGPFYCDGSDFLFDQKLLSSDPDFVNRQPIFAVPVDVIERWHQDKKVAKADMKYLLKKDKGTSYYRVKNGCNKDKLYLVQFNIDKQGNITSDINFLRGGLPIMSKQPLTLNEESTAENDPKWMPEKNLKTFSQFRDDPWILQAYPMDDDSHAKYLDKKMIKLSWDLKYPVVEVFQWLGSDSYDPLSHIVDQGDDFVVINLDDGKYLQLLVQYPPGVQYLDPFDGIELRNIAIINNYMFGNSGESPKDMLRIEPPQPKAKKGLAPLSTMVRQYRNDNGCIYNGGCVWVTVADLKTDDQYMEDLGFSISLYDLCLADNDISEDTEDNVKVKVGWDYLNEHATDWLVEKHADKIWR